MYDTISKVLNQCKSKYRVVMGDFNAKIGMDRNNIPSNIAGPFGIGAKNDRGERLLQFATAENLSQILSLRNVRRGTGPGRVLVKKLKIRSISS